MKNNLFNTNKSGEHWTSINWKKVEVVVAKLQSRIVKASEAKDMRKVRSLQRLLVGSKSAKLLATRKVAEQNQGKGTKGIDGILWTTSKEKLEGALSLSKRVKPSPNKRKWIPKNNGKLRPLGIPTMRDRASQSLWNLALLPVAETWSDKNSFGFRPYRKAWDAYDKVRIVLGRKTLSPKYVLDADLKGFFDNLSHEWLLENIPMCKKTLKGWLKAGFINSEKFNETHEGTPQGSPISPTLSNMALNGIEQFLHKFYKGMKKTKQVWRKGKLHSPKLNLVRFADDFIITGVSKRQLQRVKEKLQSEFFNERGVSFSEEKTRIIHVKEGFEFLGWRWEIGNKSGNFWGRISKNSIKEIQYKLKNELKCNDNRSISALIMKLNAIIRGWKNYHRKASGIHPVLSKLGDWFYKQLRRFLWKRSPKVKYADITKKYFKNKGTRNWVFCEDNAELISFGKVKQVEKNTMLPTGINVFDLKNKMKIIEHQLKMNNHVILNDVKNKVLERQKGLCPHCRTMITEGFDVHHIKPKSLGGSDKISNLEILHKHCHHQQTKSHSLAIKEGIRRRKEGSVSPSKPKRASSKKKLNLASSA